MFYHESNSMNNLLRIKVISIPSTISTTNLSILKKIAHINRTYILNQLLHGIVNIFLIILKVSHKNIFIYIVGKPCNFLI